MVACITENILLLAQNFFRHVLDQKIFSGKLPECTKAVQYYFAPSRYEVVWLKARLMRNKCVRQWSCKVILISSFFNWICSSQTQDSFFGSQVLYLWPPFHSIVDWFLHCIHPKKYATHCLVNYHVSSTHPMIWMLLNRWWEPVVLMFSRHTGPRGGLCLVKDENVDTLTQFLKFSFQVH